MEENKTVENVQPTIESLTLDVERLFNFTINIANNMELNAAITDAVTVLLKGRYGEKFAVKLRLEIDTQIKRRQEAANKRMEAAVHAEAVRIQNELTLQNGPAQEPIVNNEQSSETVG